MGSERLRGSCAVSGAVVYTHASRALHNDVSRAARVMRSERPQAWLGSERAARAMERALRTHIAAPAGLCLLSMHCTARRGVCSVRLCAQQSALCAAVTVVRGSHCASACLCAVACALCVAVSVVYVVAAIAVASTHAEQPGAALVRQLRSLFALLVVTRSRAPLVCSGMRFVRGSASWTSPMPIAAWCRSQHGAVEPEMCARDTLVRAA